MLEHDTFYLFIVDATYVDEHVRYGRILCENRLSFGIYMIFENYVDN